MRLFALALFLAACAHQETNAEAFRRMTGHGMNETGPAPPQPQPRRHEETPPAGPKIAAQSESVPTAADCPASRKARVAAAQDAIRAFDARIAEVAPFVKFIEKHKCHLEDTTGTTLYTAKKDSGGVRVGAKHGRPDDVVCDTAKVPPEVDADMIRFVQLTNSLPESENQHQTIPACDDIETPSLRFRFKDYDQKKAILAL